MSAPTHESSDLHGLLTRLQHDITLRDLRTGRWYSKVLSGYVANYASQPARLDLREVPVEQRAARARELTRRTALLTAAAGAGAASSVTAASVAVIESSGVAAPAVIPLAGFAMLSELLLRSILHLQLACELAELYGMPFRPGGETELIRLYALAFRAEMHETEDDPGRGLVERVIHSQETGGLGKLIAASLIGETLLRNIIPFADIAVSSTRNWQLTHQVGRFVQGYAGRRVALDEAVQRVAERSPQSVNVLVEGLWFIFICDGRLTGIETALLAHLMRQQSTAPELTTQFISDEAGWLERLQTLDADAQTRALILRALEVAAVVETPVSPAELTILRRAAKTLQVELTLEPIAEQFAPTASSTEVEAAAIEKTMRAVRVRTLAAARGARIFVTRAARLLSDPPHTANAPARAQ